MGSHHGYNTGDKLIYIKNNSPFYTYGRVYEVLGYNDLDPGIAFYIEMDDYDGRRTDGIPKSDWYSDEDYISKYFIRKKVWDSKLWQTMYGTSSKNEK